MKLLILTLIVGMFLLGFLGFALAEDIVGNDSDEHGCKASAGYSWCEGKNECIRLWETNCTNEKQDDEQENETENLNSTEIEEDSNRTQEKSNKTKEKEWNIYQKRGFVNEINRKFGTNYTAEDVRNDTIRLEIKNMIREKSKEKNRTLWLNISDKNLSIREVDEDKLELIVDKINAKTKLNLTIKDIQNVTTLTTLLSNGRWATIKILPNVISERALEVFNTRCEERNCTLELKEVANGNKTRLIYELSTDQNSRVILFFKNKMPVKAEIDAETGDIVSIKRPWWAWLASKK